MLKLYVPETELFDEETQEFYTVKGQTLAMEHSLVSISKWESKWCVPFLKQDEKTQEQMRHYIECMTITQHVDGKVFDVIMTSPKLMSEISEYINAPMTATWFNEQNRAPNRRVVTNELIYYWMTALQIPFECQKWHLNRLLTLIRVCNIESQPPKKMGKRELASRNRSLNAARRRAMHTHG